MNSKSLQFKESGNNLCNLFDTFGRESYPQ